MLGVGQRLYDLVLSFLSDRKRIAHEILLNKHHILKSNYHGGSFEVNSMRKILKFHVKKYFQMKIHVHTLN